jgi:hypothetical protein
LAGKGRISPAYFADAAIEAGTLLPGSPPSKAMRAAIRHARWKNRALW